MTLRDAYRHVKQARPIIRPNHGFWLQLIAFEERLTGTSTVGMVVSQYYGQDKLIPDVYVEDQQQRMFFASNFSLVPLSGSSSGRSSKNPAAAANASSRVCSMSSENVFGAKRSQKVAGGFGGMLMMTQCDNGDDDKQRRYYSGSTHHHAPFASLPSSSLAGRLSNRHVFLFRFLKSTHCILLLKFV